MKASTRVGDGDSGQKPRNSRSSSEKEAPLEKPAACSQMFSTPKIFRRQERMSPKPITQDEALHSSEKGEFRCAVHGSVFNAGMLCCSLHLHETHTDFPNKCVDADRRPENLYWVDTSPCLFGSTNTRYLYLCVTSWM